MDHPVINEPPHEMTKISSRTSARRNLLVLIGAYALRSALPPPSPGPMGRASPTERKKREDLWMLQGYRQPGLWNQIKDAFHFSPTK